MHRHNLRKLIYDNQDYVLTSHQVKGCGVETPTSMIFADFEFDTGCTCTIISETIGRHAVNKIPCERVDIGNATTVNQTTCDYCVEIYVPVYTIDRVIMMPVYAMVMPMTKPGLIGLNALKTLGAKTLDFEKMQIALKGDHNIIHLHPNTFPLTRQHSYV
jgi:hypothetical protein